MVAIQKLAKDDMVSSQKKSSGWGELKLFASFGIAAKTGGPLLSSKACRETCD
jgi:hypothetical protein